MKLLRKLFLSLALLLGFSYSYAANAIRIANADGTITEILLEDYTYGLIMNLPSPENHYALVVYRGYLANDEAGNLIPRPDTDSKIYFQSAINDVDNVEFIDKGAGLSDQLENAGISVDIQRGQVNIAQVNTPVEVTVAAISGLMVFSRKIDRDMTIDLTAFGEGVYVVKVGNQTFKILVQK